MCLVCAPQQQIGLDTCGACRLCVLQTRVGRAYGRVSRRRLREHLLQEASRAGVQYMATSVDDLQLSADGRTAVATCRNGAQLSAR
jgi:flavin-dependent dehydrogenase